MIQLVFLNLKIIKFHLPDKQLLKKEILDYQIKRQFDEPILGFECNNQNNRHAF